MKALQWDHQHLQVNELPCPEADPGEALIKVRRAGICNTDLEILRGYHNFTGTIGHEFVGQVEEAPDPALVGRRIVSDINCACGSCAMCETGKPHHCLHRRTIGIKHKDGAFADYLCCPLENLVALPDDLCDEAAVFAEPVAAALEILEQVDAASLDQVAVIGDGKLGLLITMALGASGLDVILIGHHRENAALVEDFVRDFHTEPPPRTFPLVVEASGNPRGFNDALGLCAATGTIVLKSTYAGGFDFNPAPLVVNEITLLGSRCGPMARAVELLASRRIEPQRLIVGEYALAEGVEAMHQAAQKGTLKILLRP